MKIKVKNDWILSFNGLRANLNMVNKETLKPTYQLGRDAMYAITRTGRLVQVDTGLLIEKEQEIQKKKQEVDKADLEEDKTKLEEEAKRLREEQDAILKKEIEVEVHKFHLKDLPADVALPEAFWEVLEPLILNGEEKK